MTTRTGLILAASALAIVASSGWAVEYRGDKGYTLQYPDGWEIATKDEQQRVTEEVRRSFSGADQGQVNAMFYDPAPDGFTENINVVIVQGRVRITASAERQVVDEMTKVAVQNGMSVSNVRSGRSKIGGRTAIWIEWDATSPQFAADLRQRIAFVPAGSRTYVLTCTAASDAYAQYEPLFLWTIDSLRIDSGGWDVWEDLPAPVRYGIIGGAAGGLIGLLRWRKARRKKAETPPVFPSSPPQSGTPAGPLGPSI